MLFDNCSWCNVPCSSHKMPPLEEGLQKCPSYVRAPSLCHCVRVSVHNFVPRPPEQFVEYLMKFCRFHCYDMKMRLTFWIFVASYSDTDTPLYDLQFLFSKLVSAISPTSLIRFFQKCAGNELRLHILSHSF